jgi:hypothetical protein
MTGGDRRDASKQLNTVGLEKFRVGGLGFPYFCGFNCRRHGATQRPFWVSARLVLGFPQLGWVSARLGTMDW